MSDAEDGTYPDNNPKSIHGVKKVPLRLIPPVAKAHIAEAMRNGAEKYGPYNWRTRSVATSVYIDAAQRHLDAYWDREDMAPDSGVHHLAHVAACCAILLDALESDNLIDDRPTSGGAARVHERFTRS